MLQTCSVDNKFYQCLPHTAGCKMNNVAIVYTAFSNLKKTQGMDVGQVGFHNPKMVKIEMCIHIFWSMLEPPSSVY